MLLTRRTNSVFASRFVLIGCPKLDGTGLISIAAPYFLTLNRLLPPMGPVVAFINNWKPRCAQDIKAFTEPVLSATN